MIIGKKVTIRPLHVEDYECFFQWWNNPDIMSSVGFPSGLMLGKDTVKKHIHDEVERDKLFADSRRFLILYKNSTPIGEINYSNWDKRNRKVFTGIKICETAFQRKGYGIDALNAFVYFLFKHLNLNKIELDTFADNSPARNLYEKIGFKQVGIKRKDYFSETSNSYEDVVLYELLRDIYFTSKWINTNS